MNALELANKLKQDELDKKKSEAKECLERTARIADEEKRMAAMILETLEPFGLPIEKKWFAGSDYWILSHRSGKAILSCVLNYVRGTFDGSDECRDIPYEQWEITVSRGLWSGPHCRNCAMGGITNQKTLIECVANIMKNEV